MEGRLKLYSPDETAASIGGASSHRPALTGFRSLSVLMPVYNEQWTIREIVHRVLRAPVSLKLELVIVDDASTDGGFEILQDLARMDRRIKLVRHPHNQGKGAAVRTAIQHMTGDVAVVQDADLEYDPQELPRLLAPILDGRADAVFGSRFAGDTRRVLFFWHSLANRILTLASNMLNDLNLTDMETCYKVVRADVLKRIRLVSNSFTIEPEITCRLSQFGARIYEVPISYSGRTYEEGKKIRAIDGLKAIWEMLRCRFLDTRFTDDSGFYILASMARASGYNRWILEQVQPYLGSRLLEAGAGIGNLSKLLLDRERLVLCDYEAGYIHALNRRFASRPNVRVDRADLTRADDFQAWRDEGLNTVFCSNVLEHLAPDEQVLKSFHDVLDPEGHCIIVVPAGPWLYTGMDAELGHCRRYTREELKSKMEQAGFEVVFEKQFSKLGTLSWAVSGHLLRRRRISPGQMKWFDRLLPAARVLERVLPVPGMSLVMVGRRPARRGQARAA
jgi:glycosyltransferase involved in cell wall biosynthesis